MLITLLPVYLLFSGNSSHNMESGYAPVNGLDMYYEIYRPSGKEKASVPLVLIHGGGSTIESNFGNILPLFSRKRTVIAMELQAHGHTKDIDRPLSFEHDADDIAALLNYLKIDKADFFGFSNGGSTVLQIGIRHPEVVNKIIAASSIYKRDGMYPWFWDLIKNASVENMPQQLIDAYLKINPDPKALKVMHDKDAKRMIDFEDWPPEDIKSVKAPVMILIGDKDVVRPEHAVEMFRLLPDAELVILPGGHGAYIGEKTMADENSGIPEAAVLIVEEFLDKPLKENTPQKSN